jgi:S1-C subfamily serine protease
MTDLVFGQRVPFEATQLQLRVSAANEPLLSSRFSVVVVFLDSADRAHMKPAYAIEGGGGLVRFTKGFTVEVDLDRLPREVVRVQAIAYALGGPGAGASFMDLGWLEADAGLHRFRIDLTHCGYATLHLMDLYRHSGHWRLLAHGQGFTGGLGVIGSRIGVALDSGHGLPDLRSSSPSPDLNDRPEHPAPGSSASGSGFAITQNHVLTNHHVIEDARHLEVIVGGRSGRGRVIFTDPHNDLALVETDARIDAVARFRASVDLHLGEDVVLIGFPLQNLLGQGPQVTAGNVSGLCGFANNSAVLQYTAPTSSGSSGGPILDASGLVIGVVRAGLAHEVVRRAGSLSENINFGVKGVLARSFLSAAGIAPQIAEGGAACSRAETAREARAYAACIRVAF